MAIDKLPGTAIATDAITADQLATGSITVADIPAGEITADKLHTTLNLSSKTITLPAASVTAHAASQLNDLTDVNTSGVANGKILKYNGSAWVIADDAGGPADTDALSEGSSNLYYTTARANSAIDSRVNASFINNLTINADTATTLATGRTISGVTFDGSQNITLNTSTITENTNLYYTDARVKASTLTAGSLRGSVNNATVQYGSSYSGTPAQGSFFFDSLNAKLKVYDGSTFLDAVPAGGGGGGGGSTDANTTFRKYLYTIGSVTNAVSGKDDVVVTAGSFVTGYVYIIVSTGNTDFTTIGSANNTVGTQFTATGAGSGTGTASHKLNYVTDGTENVEVYVNGIKQIQGSSNDYVATSGTTVNFVSNLAVNDEVEINVFELLTNTSNFASLTVDTSTLVVNGTTNRVGIGTATPFTRAVVGGGSGTEVLTIFSGSGGEGQLRFADATSGTGAYQGRVEYDHSAGKLNLGAGGTTPFTIDSNGRVGIGRNNPDTQLHIDEGTSNSYATIRLEGNNRGGDIEMYQGTLPVSTIRTDQSGNMFFKTSGAYGNSSVDNRLTILTAGNVGIGTTNPTVKLTTVIPHSNGAVAEGLKLTTNGSYSSSNSEEAGPALSFGQFHSLYPTWKTGQISGIRDGANWHGSLSFWTNSGSSETNITEKMRVTGDGRVGIGTTGPTHMLEVKSSGNAGQDFIKVLDSDNNQQFRIYSDSSTGEPVLRLYDTSGSAKIVLHSNGDSRFEGGNVGIGTNPASWARLDILGSGGAQNGANQAMQIKAPSATPGEGVGIRLSATSGSHEAVGIIGMVNNASGNSGAMTFHTYNLGATIPERMRIDNEGNVGIGTNSPVTYSNYKYCHVHATTNAYLKLTNNTTGTGINDGFDIVATGSDAYLINRENGIIAFTNNGSERMRLTTGGYLDLTSESQVRVTLGNQGTPGTNTANWIRGTGTNLGFNSAGGGFHFEVGGNNKVNIDNNGRFGIGTGGNTIQGSLVVKDITDHNGADVFVVAQNGNASRQAGYKVFDEGGTSSLEMKYDNGSNFARISNPNNGQLSINLGGTGSANMLSDYEVGQYNPTFGATSAGGSVSYSSQNGRYVKIGQFCRVWFDITISSASGMSGVATVSLPFASTGGYYDMGAFTPWAISNNFTAGYTPTQWITLNVSYMMMYKWAGDSAEGHSQWNVNQTGRISGSVSYTTA